VNDVTLTLLLKAAKDALDDMQVAEDARITHEALSNAMVNLSTAVQLVEAVIQMETGLKDARDFICGRD